MTKNNWTKCKLGDVLEVTSSKRVFAKDYVCHGVPFYRSKEVIEKHSKLSVSTELFITENHYNKIKKTFGVPACGDILFTSVGTIGIPYIVQQNERFYFKDGNLTWFKNYKNINNIFLYYWFISPIGKNEIFSNTIGSTQQAITISALKNINILLPPLDEQKRIAGVLGAFDDKIELLQKQNKTLEDMAKAIFKSWFVDFDIVKAKQRGEDKQKILSTYKITEELYNLFPSSFTDAPASSSLGPIPTGWEVEKLGNICNIFTGKKDVNETSETGIYTFFSCSPKTFLSNEFIYDGKAVIVAGNGSYTGRVCFFDGKFDLYQRTYACVEKEGKYQNLMFLVWHAMKYFFEPKYMGGTRGSSIPYIVKSDLSNFNLLICQTLLPHFNVQINPLVQKNKSNDAQIKTLTELRDGLLPRLLSGKLRV